jgi:hypothetical protein
LPNPRSANASIAINELIVIHRANRSVPKYPIVRGIVAKPERREAPLEKTEVAPVHAARKYRSLERSFAPVPNARNEKREPGFLPAADNDAVDSKSPKTFLSRMYRNSV